ncbi:hypothetical protein WICANDRAFT_33033 [Wickerhamomyces anomalus NRRL Y-366-8]|uniref:Peptidase S8/S53 domain-containing protein n=1 Tax=Wickerhamomyces anomalus (strain ATCC 58044 / CBS 1984 / NCYC 433 / NRRL Y-366-8) TaxID=683960 RepID=A0A1E3P1I8_WICAA|nr:uncharacterized protein WICANDRAFT_33033 [Wickerhamomyces anomalus NRRL Y-366-8]ODQ59203.1 hypothetical protein WICANDRAFT_33033 [Wickerhamomyces anomalus NRRL Y-366-8]
MKISTLFFPTLVISGYVIQFKDSLGLKQLLDQDDKSNVLHHIRPYITNKLTIGSFQGIAGNFTDDVVKRLKSSPFVKDIVPDVIVKAFESEQEINSELTIHLARLSRNAKLPSNQAVNYYHEPVFNGKGVFVYIIDTGINKEHPEFEGRAIFGADFTSEGDGDRNNHGTHVAGVVGSKTYGVAKEATLVEVKALDRLGQGSLSTVLAALEFAVNDRKSRGVPGVVNLSLGSAKNTVLNQAIKAAVESGLVVAAAAGNANIDSCLTSPASSSFAITVGAIDDKTDSIAHFSNWGNCVDVFASGVLVNSVDAFNYDNPLVHSGTSMASPSVSGLSAILLQKGVPVNEISNQIKLLSTKDQINRRSKMFRPSTPDRIANNGVQKHDDVYPEEKIEEGNIKDDDSFDSDRLRKFKDGEPRPDDLKSDDSAPQSVGGLDIAVDKHNDESDSTI